MLKERTRKSYAGNEIEILSFLNSCDAHLSDQVSGLSDENMREQAILYKVEIDFTWCQGRGSVQVRK